MGCLPLYPIWKDFPFELKNHPECLYRKRDLNDAEEKLRSLMDKNTIDTSDVWKKHDLSWNNYLKIMENN